MKNHIDSNILPQLAAQIAQKTGASPGAFTLSWADGLTLGQPAQASRHFKTPVRAGAMLNEVARRLARPASESLPETIAFGPYVFHPRRSLIAGAGGEIALTDKERDILAVLWQAPGRRLSREDLLAGVWAYAEGVETHTLETHVYRLRRKIEDDPGAPRWLVNEEGFYRLNA